MTCYNVEISNILLKFYLKLDREIDLRQEISNILLLYAFSEQSSSEVDVEKIKKKVKFAQVSSFNPVVFHNTHSFSGVEWTLLLQRCYRFCICPK